MARSKSYDAHLIESLQDPREAAAYLVAAIEDEDPHVFLLALRDVVQVRCGGMRSLAKKAGLNRESLYRMLSKHGNPELESLNAVLDVLGLHLSIEVKKAS